MYSRGIFQEDEDTAINVPKNYSGSAFPTADEVVKDTTQDEQVFCDKKEDSQSVAAGVTPSYGRLFDFTRLFGTQGFFKGITEKFRNIGFEEILIIAIAFFLFLSKDGDKECAIMLALLLFVG